MESLSFLRTGEASEMFPRSGTCTQTGNYYTTPDGLNFTTHCGEDVVSSTYSSYVPTEKNFTACMDDCSTESWRCWGVLWQESNSSCWELSAPTVVTVANLTASDTRDIALANSTQMSGDPSCPYDNNSVLNTAEGLDFELACYMEISGNDLCPWGSEFCPSYAVSLEECMEACVQAHPLCQAAMWNPGHLAGYLNCFLKNATGPLVEPTGNIYHTAVAQVMTLAQGCPTYSNYTSSDGKAFNITCSQQATQATNLTVSHQNNITACIDSCASYDGTAECEAVVFDAAMDTGYENCQLLNSIQMLDSSTTLNMAQIVSSSSDPASSSSSGSSSSSSKAWIAGPVIGGVAAIVAIVLAWFWWNRRKRRSEAPTQALPTQQPTKQFPTQENKNFDTVDNQNNQDFITPPETKSHQEELHSVPLSELVASERVELPSQGHPAHEMPA